jgi:D-alanyl-lipoteichoic acid acyltransferase DltB (MBOAT superfamily)
MLFNSHGFLFIFLPLTLLAFHLLCKAGRPSLAISALIGASLVFYGWWEPRYLLLIITSVLVNYALSLAIAGRPQGSRRLWLLWLGVVINLGALAWFKYANFLVDSGNALLGTQIHVDRIILPLAISFFTFQQIAYLVDTYRGSTAERSFQRYALFVTFFPQLIAGPIVHHKEMLPQFATQLGGLRLHNLIVGGSLFFIGLFKKVIIADGVSPYSDTVFTMAANGEVLTFLEAWTGALAYSLQLYFDFSGYSDMAMGLAILFGIRLPMNFNSPYKASSIIDFWRRWHMTLSRFLRDYLYFVLGGNRHGLYRTVRNLMIVMLLGGLWHGAGWTFVLWGGLHGLYLLINHVWRHWFATTRLHRWQASYAAIQQDMNQPDMNQPDMNQHDTNRPTITEKLMQTVVLFFGRCMSQLLTLLAVIFAWVLFRAENLDIAGRVYAGMFGLNGVALPAEWLHNHESLGNSLSQFGILFQPLANMGPLFTPLRDLALIAGAQIQVDSVGTVTAFVSLIVPIAIALWMPNSLQLMRRYEPAYANAIHPSALSSVIEWRMNTGFAIVMGVVAAYACFGSTVTSQFLYFQF